MTPRSDLDTLVVFSNNTSENQKEAFREELKSIHFEHPLETYPFASLAEWQWIASNSILYSADLHYATPVWGDSSLLLNLMSWVRTTGVSSATRLPYLMYNRLYRRRQLQGDKPSESLKYRFGGSREFQSIKWHAIRFAACRSPDPSAFLPSLLDARLIARDQLRTLHTYVNSVLEAKLSAQVMLSPDIQHLWVKAASVIWEMQNQSILRLTKYHDRRHSQIIALAVDGKDFSLDFDASMAIDESTALAIAWHSRRSEVLRDILIHYGNFWSIRAAAALNPYLLETDQALLGLNRYCDSSDIDQFLERSHSA